MSQTELARRADTTQSAISAYESGRREPTVPTLERLLAASGADLVLDARIERPAVVAPALTPALRRELSRVAVRHGLRHVRLFGSFARGEAGADSDVDLLVQIPDSMTLWGLTCAADELSEVAGMRVDLAPDSNLRPGVRERVLAEAIPL